MKIKIKQGGKKKISFLHDLPEIGMMQLPVDHVTFFTGVNVFGFQGRVFATAFVTTFVVLVINQSINQAITVTGAVVPRCCCRVIMQDNHSTIVPTATTLAY